MGMLFNTPATTRTLEILNTVFNTRGLTRIRTEGYGPTIMPHCHTPAGTYQSLAVPLGIDHNDNAMSGKWKDWLTKIFDVAKNPDNTPIALIRKRD